MTWMSSGRWSTARRLSRSGASGPGPMASSRSPDLHCAHVPPPEAAHGRSTRVDGAMSTQPMTPPSHPGTQHVASLCSLPWSTCSTQPVSSPCLPCLDPAPVNSPGQRGCRPVHPDPGAGRVNRKNQPGVCHQPMMVDGDFERLDRATPPVASGSTLPLLFTRMTVGPP